MNTKKLNKILSIFYPLIAIAVVLLLWFLLFKSVGSEFIFPSIKTTFQQMGKLFVDGTFWQAFLSTLGRVFLCFVLSLACAIVLGVLSHLVTPVGKVIAPIIAIFRSAPTVAIMIILTLLSNPKVAPIVVGLMVVFPMTYASVTSALKQVDNDTLQMCKLYKVPVGQQLKYVYLPTVTPYLFGELPATLSFTVKLVISAEILSNTYQSFGGLIQSANIYVDMASLFALTILSIIFATLLDGVLTFVTKLVGGKK